MQIVDEQADRGAGESGAKADVVQPTVVADRDAATGIDLKVVHRIGPSPLTKGFA